jgi:hypothetical protein
VKALLAGGVLLVLLFAAACGDEPEQVSDRGTLDGILTSVTDEEIVVQPLEGSTPLHFAVRPIDARRLDLLHLRLHASQRLPSRVHYEEVGDTRYVTRVDDL